MATIKVACPKCGQKVSGDESFFGTTVECPICSADIYFPGNRREADQKPHNLPVAPVPAEDSPPPAPVPKSDYRPSVDMEPEAVKPPAEEKVLSKEQPEKPQDQTSTPSREKSGVVDEDGDESGPCSPIYGAISIVSAVLAVVTCVGGILFAPIAIIFGHTALAKARHSSVQPAPGHTLGAIGLMIGYVSLVITIIVLLLLTFFGDAIREAIQPPQE